MKKNEFIAIRKKVEELESQVELLTLFLKESIEIRMQLEMTDYESYINKMLP